MSFDEMPLRKQYEALARLRAIVAALEVGNHEPLNDLLSSADDVRPDLPALAAGDASELADEVDSWLSGGAA